jgi:hypothetical protein
MSPSAGIIRLLAQWLAGNTVIKDYNVIMGNMNIMIVFIETQYSKLS